MFVDRIIPDFGWNSPHRTKRECAHPDLADHNLHRTALMKKEYHPDGLPGWSTKLVCNGCKREFKSQWFIPLGDAATTEKSAGDLAKHLHEIANGIERTPY